MPTVIMTSTALKLHRGPTGVEAVQSSDSTSKSVGAYSQSMGGGFVDRSSRIKDTRFYVRCMHRAQVHRKPKTENRKQSTAKMLLLNALRQLRNFKSLHIVAARHDAEPDGFVVREGPVAINLVDLPQPARRAQVVDQHL